MAHLPPRLSGKSIAILSATGIHEHEFWVPYYRFREEDAKVIVCGFEKNAVYKGEGRHGMDGLDLAPTDATIEEIRSEDLDALIIPGGIYGPLALRAHKPTLKLVRAMNERKKVIAAICHGPWVLVSADVLQGRKCTGPNDIAVDMTNAGGVWVKEDAVRDENLITSVYFGYLPKFLRLIVEAVETQGAPSDAHRPPTAGTSLISSSR